MLRRLVIALAATSALVLTATAPALADHDADIDSDFKPLLVEGNLANCSALIDWLEVSLPPEGDAGLQSIIDALNEHSDWNDDETKNTAPGGTEIDEAGWWTTLFETNDDGEPNGFLTVEVEPGVQVWVIVKGGSEESGEPFWTYIFRNLPGDDLIDLYAPTNASGKHPPISDYSICKLGKEDGDDDENGKDDDEENGETPAPNTTTPAAVPTEVPAGASGSGDGSSMAPVGIAAAAVMMLTGAAVLVRRRLLHQS